MEELSVPIVYTQNGTDKFVEIEQYNTLEDGFLILILLSITFMLWV